MFRRSATGPQHDLLAARVISRRAPQLGCDEKRINPMRCPERALVLLVLRAVVRSAERHGPLVVGPLARADLALAELNAREPDVRSFGGRGIAADDARQPSNVAQVFLGMLARLSHATPLA
jgi:hypothetical protein